jgi:hypothetical protein
MYKLFCRKLVVSHMVARQVLGVNMHFRLICYSSFTIMLSG